MEDPDKMAEMQQLREENATFRDEIDSLRMKLTEKMRGQSKVIAGGQYRAASVSGAAKEVLKPDNFVCTKCSSTRARAIEANYDRKQAQATSVELRAYVDKVEAARQQLWEERSLHMQEIAKLRDKVAERVELCVLTEAKCTELKLELRKTSFKSRTPSVLVDKFSDTATQCTLQQSCDEAAKLKEEVTYLGQQLVEYKQKWNSVSKNLESVMSKMKLEKEQRDNDTSVWHEETAELKRQVLELERSKQATIHDLEFTHKNELELIRTINQELSRDLAAKEAELLRLYQDHKMELVERERKHETLVKALKKRIELKVADTDRLQSLMADYTTAKTEITAMKRRIQDLENQL